MSKNEKIIFIAIFAVSVIIIAGGVYFWWDSRSYEAQKITDQLEEAIEEIIIPKDAVAGNFATYQQVGVDIEPSIAAYSVKSDFSNILNAEQIYLSDQAEELLVKNNFVVVPSHEDEFFSIYENNRYDFIPSFITTDSVLHNYHLLFSDLLKKIEEGKLYDALAGITDEMLEDSLEQYDKLEGTEWKTAARRNIAFFSVAKKLLDEDVKVDKLVRDEVEAELDMIEEHQGIRVSEVVNIGQDKTSLDAYREDYSQYVARGHYTKSENLKKYFKAMMWYGRVNWRLKMDEETKSAILMTQAMRKNNKVFKNWEMIYEPVNFFVGKTDDLNFYDYNLVYDQIFMNDNITNAGQFDKFSKAAKNLDKPKINSMPIFQEEIMPDRDEEIFGWRFMGQRYTVDAEIFQHLIEREVSDRFLPKALDIPAAFGSDLAYEQLESEGEFEYGGYQDNLDKMRKYVSELEHDVWTQNLYWAWLYGLNDLVEPAGKGYPSFMTNKAWQYKDLQTFAGSWTELKHDTILYAKQVYAELGGAPTDEGDDRGYVEPRPYVYARMASLVKMTSEGLQVRELISQEDVELLKEFEDVVLRLKNISEKELNEEKLSEEDFEFIKFYGGTLEKLWLAVHEDEGVTDRKQLSDNPAALIADVATDPNGEVLEEAIGKVDTIYAVFPLEGKLRIGKGGVFSHYEFKQPINDRLTDEDWYAILHTDPPARAEWQYNFLEKRQ